MLLVFFVRVREILPKEKETYYSYTENIDPNPIPFHSIVCVCYSYVLLCVYFANIK